MASTPDKDLKADARNFCDSLANVFMMKRRDPQTQHLLEKSKGLIEALLQEKRAKTDRPVVPPKPPRAGSSGMGQLWMKLDELKRENDELKKKVVNKKADDKTNAAKNSGPGEVIISELHKCKSENEALKVKLEKSMVSIKELENVNLTLQDEFKRTKIAQEMTQESLEKIRRERKNLETSLDSVKTENDSLKMRLTNSVKPIKRPDARFVENINERCRPSTVASEYNQLESQEWVDAKEGLEEAGFEDEEAAMKFLVDMLMTCFTVSTELLSVVENGIAEIIKDPCKLMETSYLNNGKGLEGQLPEELLTSIKDNLRENSDGVDVEPLVTKCKERIVSSGKWNAFEGLLNHKSINRYLVTCARITWKMAAQQTQMWLCTSDTCFDEDKHKLWWSCDRNQATCIKYFVWPALYDSKNGNLLVRGCVFTENEANGES